MLGWRCRQDQGMIFERADPLAPRRADMNPATREAPDRNLAMELVRTTEAAALAAAR